ncbi:MAG: hypothetical protein A2X12_09595 [Bacteroidetes bacterium GWE2_29_8]|nr:MAG: hypothetical protein A2X12_09595 [Bacteroidetes bacterium GWE2_29_8]OFY20074.1 MAG: hypothetical protein A2X02_06835 [Bacteroidetes bacterium GWF2_29_10]
MKILEASIKNYVFTLVFTFIGLLITYFSILLALFTNKLGFSANNLILLNQQNPFIAFIYIFPFIFIFFGFVLDYHRNKHIECKKKFIREEDKILKFIDKLKTGYVNNEYLKMEQDNKLNDALLSLRDNIARNKDEEEKRRKEDNQRNWTTEGLAKFGEILRLNNDNVDLLSYDIIYNLVKYMKANQGGFFMINDDHTDDKYIELIACFAYEKKKYLTKRIEWGEGLVGGAIFEMDTIYMTEVPQDYVNITSGLGESNPSSILIVPLKVNNIVYGAIEIASFKTYETFEIELIERLAESIATTISSVKTNVRTAKLLMESQDQAFKMAQQEEEMRQNMEELQAIQEEAEKQSKLLETFTDSVNQTLIRADFNINGEFVYANRKFIEKLGYSEGNQLNGKGLFNFIDAKDKTLFLNVWDDLKNGKENFEGDIKLIRKDSKDLWTKANMTCILDKDGNVEKVLFLGIDTTEQKIKDLDFHSQIKALESSAIKCEFDINGKLENYNDIFLKTLKYDPSELSYKRIFKFIAPEELTTFNKVWEDIIVGSNYKGQMKFLTSNDKEVWLHSTIVPIKDIYGEISKIFLIANDVTEQKLLEIESLKQNEELKIRDEKLKQSQVELARKLQETKEEMLLQFKEIENIKIKNERILEGFLDAIVSFNSKGIIEFFNKAAEDIWETKKEEVIGESMRMLFPSDVYDDDKDIINDYLRSFIGTRTEVNIKTKSGELISVLITIAEAQLNKQSTYSMFVQNISVELF